MTFGHLFDNTGDEEESESDGEVEKYFRLLECLTNRFMTTCQHTFVFAPMLHNHRTFLDIVVSFLTFLTFFMNHKTTMKMIFKLG